MTSRVLDLIGDSLGNFLCWLFVTHWTSVFTAKILAQHFSIVNLVRKQYGESFFCCFRNQRYTQGNFPERSLHEKEHCRSHSLYIITRNVTIQIQKNPQRCHAAFTLSDARVGRSVYIFACVFLTANSRMRILNQKRFRRRVPTWYAAVRASRALALN